MINNCIQVYVITHQRHCLVLLLGAAEKKNHKTKKNYFEQKNIDVEIHVFSITITTFFQ